MCKGYPACLYTIIIKVYIEDIPLPVNGSYLTPTHFPFPYQLHPQINLVDYPFLSTHLIVKYTCGHYLTLSPV